MKMRISHRPLLEPLEPRALLTAGALDPSFGNGGYVTNTTLQAYGSAVHAAVQPWDGKTVLAGSYSNSTVSNIIGVYRYNTDGTPDTGFGAGGLATINVSGGNDTPYAVVADPATEKIDIVGLALVNGYYDYSVSRLNPNGSLDTTFGTHGSVTVAVGSDNWDTPSAATIDGQGRLVVVGSSVSSRRGTYEYEDTILRFTAAGKLDTTFGNKGVVNGPLGAWTNDGWNLVMVQPDNSITVEGQDNSQNVIARYSPTGALQGRSAIQTPPNPYNTAQTIGVGTPTFLANGDLVTITGLSNAPNRDSVVALARYTPTGTLDTTFGNGGLAITDLTTAAGYATGSPTFGGVDALTIDPSGRIILGGDFGPITVVNGQRTVGIAQQLLLRFTPGGTIDTTFGNGGLALSPLGSYNDSLISSVAAQPDGNIIAIGSVGSSNGSSDTVFAVARYLGNSTASAPAAAASSAAPQINPTLIPLILDDASFLNSLATQKRRHA